MLALALLCLTQAGPVRSQIYAGTHADGSAELSNHRSAHTPLLLIGAEPAAPPPAATIDTPAPARPLPAGAPTPPPETLQMIKRLAREHAVPEALVQAVIAVESGFNPRARSVKGAIGLMQLMPATARRFGATDAWAVEQNLRAGIAYLRWLLDLFDSDVSLALAAYNAGEAAVLRAGRRVPDFAETRAYVPKVLAHHAHYSALAR